MDANNEATIEMEVSMQPGDNFRAAVVLDPADFSDLQTSSRAQRGYLSPDGDPPQGFKGGVSEMLTVWRALNLEFDTMAAVPQITHPDWQMGRALAWPLSNRIMMDTMHWVNSVHAPDDFYAGGFVETPSGRIDILNSVLHSNTIELKSAVSEADQSVMQSNNFLVHDDDLRGLTPSDLLPRMLTITDLMKARFVTSYIELKDVGSLNTNPHIPFVANVSPEDVNIARNVTGTSGFWNHLIVAAHQPHFLDEDRDPNSETPTMGLTIGGIRQNSPIPPQSAIYLEVIRDRYHDGLMRVDMPNFVTTALETFRIEVQGCIAHEIAHGPTILGYASNVAP